MLRVNRKLEMEHNVWVMWLMPKEIVSRQKEKSLLFPRYTLMNGTGICQLLSGSARKVTFKSPVFAVYHLVRCKISAEVTAFPKLVPVSWEEAPRIRGAEPEGQGLIAVP